MSGTTEVGAITSCGASKLPGRGTRNSSATFKSSNILCTTVPELIISLSFTVAGPTPHAKSHQTVSLHDMPRLLRYPLQAGSRQMFL